jgi:hypothetical protein
VFYSWPELRFWLISAGVFGSGVAAFYGVRRRRSLIRIPARTVSLLTCLLSFTAMSLALMGLVLGCNSHSEPLLSPSGDKAARVETDDEGATGGGSGVSIYSNHGLSVHHVMYGTYRAVDRDGLRWIGDSTLEIKYRGTFQFCSDAGGVHVICIPR